MTKKRLAIAIVIFLIAALVVPVIMWMTLPKVEEVSGILGYDRSGPHWVLMTATEDRTLHYYVIKNPESLTRWVDCDRCLYHADLKLRVFSTKKGEMHGGKIAAHDAEVAHVWNIVRDILKPECTHKK